MAGAVNGTNTTAANGANAAAAKGAKAAAGAGAAKGAKGGNAAAAKDLTPIIPPATVTTTAPTPTVQGDLQMQPADILNSVLQQLMKVFSSYLQQPPA